MGNCAYNTKRYTKNSSQNQDQQRQDQRYQEEGQNQKLQQIELKRKLDECNKEVQDNLSAMRNEIFKIQQMEEQSTWFSYISMKEEQIKNGEAFFNQIIPNKNNIKKKLDEIDKDITLMYAGITAPTDIQEFYDQLIKDYEKLASGMDDIETEIKQQQESLKCFNNYKNSDILEDLYQLLNFQNQYNQISQSWNQAQKNVFQQLIDEMEEISLLVQKQGI